MTEPPELETPTGRPAGDVPKLRQCLRCSAEFESEWSGERICRRCKSSATWRSGTPHSFSSSGRR